MKKTLDILGIVAAWLLSIVLVVMLIVTPIVFSALSLLNGQTVTKVLTEALTAGQTEQPSAEHVEVVTLSNTSQSTEAVGKDLLTGILGDAVSQEQINSVLSSNAAKALIKAYTDDLTGAFTGSTQEKKFNAETVKGIVNDNIDEIVDVAQTVIPECADMDKDVLKSGILEAVDEAAEELVQALPKPEEIKQQLTENNPALETAMEILAKKNTIKLVAIGAIVVLSVLIFACRIPGLRGFRWLAVILFVGGGIGAFVSVGLLVSRSALSQIAQEAGQQVADMVGSLLGAFTTGVLTRTAVMLVAGGALLTVYILIKKKKAKKCLAEEVQAREERA